ncbi:MAG: NAD-binding protein, partial [candidate division Zixibacteria bacterium]|nr:NAD-binding protein [candidate division Zixibacteria bacterium]
MRIVIVGGGVVGQSLAEHLIKEKHKLSMVEMDAGLCQSMTEKLDLQLLNGSGSSPSVLMEAGLADADLVLAVTPNDEVNMIVCAIAAQYNVGQRIARLRSREFAEENSVVDLSRIGVTSVIHPEKVLVDHILQFVETPHAVESANFEDGRILLRGYRVRE